MSISPRRQLVEVRDFTAYFKATFFSAFGIAPAHHVRTIAINKTAVRFV